MLCFQDNNFTPCIDMSNIKIAIFELFEYFINNKIKEHKI